MSIEIESSCRPVFNKRRILTEGGMHVGNFPIEKGYYEGSNRKEKVVHVGKLLSYKVIQFSSCSDSDRFVMFNRRGVSISNVGEGKFSSN